MKLYSSIKVREITGLFFEMRVSLQIILLLFILFFSVLIGGYLAIHQLKTFKYDAFTINNMGIIRGSIQRITKKELNNDNSDDLIMQLDNTIERVKPRYIDIDTNSFYMNQKNLNEIIQQLESEWVNLKKLYYRHRIKKIYSREILQQSELCWDRANVAVYTAQKINEKKLANYKKQIIYILFLICIIILTIIALVYKIVHKSLERDVITDSMTKLYNRNYFDKILLKQEELSQRYHLSFSLILCDIDYFKLVNDDFGHPKGDQVLILLSKLLNENTRAVDYVFRLGGEEFAIILPQSNLEQSIKIAEKYRKLISETEFDIGRNLTVSMGVSQYSLSETSETLFQRTDKALYQAKSAGRNRVMFVQE